jgi:hypothetical protein
MSPVFVPQNRFTGVRTVRKLPCWHAAVVICLLTTSSTRRCSGTSRFSVRENRRSSMINLQECLINLQTAGVVSYKNSVVQYLSVYMIRTLYFFQDIFTGYALRHGLPEGY